MHTPCHSESMESPPLTAAALYSISLDVGDITFRTPCINNHELAIVLNKFVQKNVAINENHRTATVQ